jgi:penicillin-binding protein 2
MNPKIVRMRVLLFRCLIILVFIALSLQLWRLQIIEGKEYRLRADNNRFRTEMLDAPRGVIYDRRGTIQVRNRPSFTVRLIPANVPDDEVERESEFALLASLLDMPVTADPNDNRLALAREAFQPLAFPPPPIRNPKGIRQAYQEGLIVPYNPTVLKTGVDKETAALISELMVRTPGVDLTIEPVRQYLNGPLTAQVLGYVGHIPEEEIDRYRAAGYEQNDPVGLTGVELTYEEQLRGRRGHKTIEVDVSGREVRTVGSVVEPVPGNNLVLTLDTDLQRIMESALRKAWKTLSPSQGSPSS